MDIKPIRDRELVVFGCSYTDWEHWPTWADYMGFFYKDLHKYVYGGTGNRQIFNSLINFIRSDNYKKDTHFFVQWSALTREDRMMMDYEHRSKWTSAGNVHTSSMYPKDFVKDVYSTYQVVYESINYIYAGKKILELLGNKYGMTFMLDPRVDVYLGEPSDQNAYKNTPVGQWEKVQDILKEFDHLIDENFTQSCLTMHNLDYIEQFGSNYTSSTKGDPDSHTGPMQGYLFVKNYISKLFTNIEIDKYPELLECAKKWQTYTEIPSSNKLHLEPDCYPFKERFDRQNKRIPYSNVY